MRAHDTQSHTHLYDVSLRVGDGLPQELHLGAHRLERVQSENVRFEHHVDRVLLQQLVEQVLVT